MSASREKKQRQGAGTSEKAAQVQQDQAAYKRKARIYTVIGVVVVVLVAALLIWNSGLFQTRATAATIGDEKLTVSELSYYYYDARYIYAAYGLVDTSVADDQQVYNAEDGTTYRDFFLETALDNAKLTLAMYDAAVANGYSMSDIQEALDAEIDSMKQSAATNGYSYKAFLRAVYGRFMTPGVFKNLTARSLLANEYYSDIYNEKLDSFTAEDLEAYYAENADSVDTIEYSYLYFRAETVTTTDDEGNERTEDEIAELTAEAMESAEVKALAALNAYESGSTVAELIEEYEVSSSADHTSVVGVDSVNSVFRDQLLELGADEATVVEYEDNGYYLVVFHSKARNEELTANVRHILFRAETTTDENGSVVAPSEEAWAAALAEAEAALAEYEAGEMTAEAFAALAEKYSDDTGSNTNGGLYENVTEGYFVTEFNDWMFGEDRPEAGDTSIIRHEGTEGNSSAYWGYHVTYMDSWDDAEWQLSVRDTLVDEAVTEWRDSLVESGYETALANGANNLGR